MQDGGKYVTSQVHGLQVDSRDSQNDQEGTLEITTSKFHVKYLFITLVRVCFPACVFSSFEIGGTGGGASRSSTISTSSFRLTAKLCRMQHARIICAPFSGEYCRTPPDRSRHRKRLFNDPKVRSTTEWAALCAVLYCFSALVLGSLIGVNSHSVNGYASSPKIQPPGRFPDAKIVCKLECFRI